MQSYKDNQVNATKENSTMQMQQSECHLLNATNWLQPRKLIQVNAEK